MSKTPSTDPPKSLGGDMAKPMPKGPRLYAETRQYMVTEADLSEWLSGAAEPRFYISEIWVQPSGDVEFTVTTAKPTERPVVRRVGAPNDLRPVNVQRAEMGLPPLEEEEIEPEDDGEAVGEAVQTGPTIVDDGQPVGKADPVPMIAPKRHEGMKVDRFKTARELRLEAQRAQRPKEPRITHIEDGSDDPVPSALPRI